MSKLAAIIMLLFAGLVTAAQAAPRDAVLVSRADGATGAAADDVTIAASSISADGRFVAFVSLADNLSDVDDDAYSSVFVRDLQASTTTYVSRADGEGGEAAHGFAGVPSISADGRFVAFDSSAGNLSEQDDDRFRDIFVRDLEASTTTFVSRASDVGGVAGAAGDSASNSASISAEGRSVAFVSGATNLSNEDNDSFQNVYVRDLVTRTTTYLSRASDEGGVPGAPADGISDAPAISANGRFVVFESSATNLSEEDGNLLRDVFVRDLQARTTTLVSRASDEAGLPGAPGNGDSAAAAISADGRYVAFQSVANNLSDEDTDGSRSIFVRDLGTGTTTYVSGTVRGGAKGPSISADGRRIAFQQEVNSPIGEIVPGENIFVRDLRRDTTTFVGRASPDPGEAEINEPLPAVDLRRRAPRRLRLRREQPEPRGQRLGAEPVRARPSRSRAGSSRDRFAFARARGHHRARGLCAVADACEPDNQGVSRRSVPALLWPLPRAGDRRLRRTERTPASAAAGRSLVHGAGRAARDGRLPPAAPGAQEAGEAADAPHARHADRPRRHRQRDHGGLPVQAEEGPMIALAAAALVAGLLVLASPAKALPPGATVLVDRPSGFGALPFDGVGESEVGANSLSSDGCFVVFSSHADVLSATDDNAAENVFRLDLCRAGSPLHR